MGRYQPTILDTIATVLGKCASGDVVRVAAARGLGVPSSARNLWLRLRGVLGARLQAVPAAAKRPAAGRTDRMHQRETMRRLCARSRREATLRSGAGSGF